METANNSKRKKKRQSTVSIVAAVCILFIFLIIFTVRYYSNLNDQLFEERRLHLIEFTDKVSEVIESVVDSSWKQVYACRHMLRNGGGSLDTEQGLMSLLGNTGDFIDADESVVLVMGRDGNYFSSDGGRGYWTESGLTAAGAADSQQAVVGIPHIPGKTWFLFMERLPEPLVIRESGEELTHVAVAVDIDTLRDEISIRGFGERGYSYIINSDGRRLYKYTYEDNFITGYNILRAIGKYPVVNGGTYEELYDALENGESAALEFEYSDGTTGESCDWFVACSDIASADWKVMLFVPTDVLGANTNAIMNQAVRFFLVMAALLICIFCMMMFLIMSGREDRRMIAHQEKANAALSAAVKEAESANKAKSEFLAYMSHDIRTPINGIMGMTDIAMKHVGDSGRVLNCLDKIHASSEHLMNLINDVLNMTRIESGKTVAGHAPFDIRTCMANCASIIGGQLLTRDVELVREFEQMEHPLVIGDELHLRQIFINILGNSVKFTPDGGKIYFRGREIRTEGKTAVFRFELEDTGIGMKPEFLPHIFEPFMQEDGGARTTYKGTGLGMAITRQLVDLLGGTIQVESRLNEGTKFVLEMPVEIDFDSKVEEIEEPAGIDLSDMRVLLVEDNELNMEIAQFILEEQGVVVSPVENGLLAVEAFESHPAGTYDAILMDIMMPVMDGIAATKAIRRLKRPDARTIPILAMTANAYEEDMRKTKEAGMNAHLSKPINTDMLFRTLGYFYTRKRHPRVLDLTGGKILVAEDNDLNMEIAREILEDGGLTTVCVENGRLAVEAFCSHPPGTFNLILMDVHMPDMDGIAAARAIRASGRDDAGTIPILALTASLYEEDMQEAKEAGMNGHLMKPFDMEKLTVVLEESLLGEDS